LQFKKNYGEIINKLLHPSVPKECFNIDLQDNNGWTALHVAAFHGHDRWVMKLLDSGANPDLLNLNGQRAVEFGRYQSTKLLFTDFPKVDEAPESPKPTEIQPVAEQKELTVQAPPKDNQDIEK